MMPLIVKNFSWHQTPTTISIVVSIPGIIPQKTDILTSNNYVRIHCHPHIFEAFLWGKVEDERGSCTMDKEKGTVFLNFPKTVEPSTPPDEDAEDKADDTVSHSFWPSLEAEGLDRLKKKVLRDAAVDASHKRYRKDAETAACRRDKLRQSSVLEQIRMDEESRAKVAAVKKAEADRALEDMKRWSEEGDGGGLIPGETMSRVISPMGGGGSHDQFSNRPGGSATAERMARNRPPPRPKKNCQETLEELIARGPSQASVLSSSQPDNLQDQNLYELDERTRSLAAEARSYFEGSGSTATPSGSATSIWPELRGHRVGAGDGDVIGVRQPQRITVAFTPREFPTPARESNAPLEEEWLKKQAEARHLSGFNEPDLRPEERDPDWLLEKGISLMKKDCQLGAVSAFSLGIKLAPKLPELYAERARAQLQLRNFVKVVDDASVALELFTPKVPANAGDRWKCHLTRADGFHALNLYREELLDVKEAMKLTPDDELLIARVEDISALVDETASDSDVD